jgi:hypothetical protein
LIQELRQAYDYWQDQPDSYTTRRSSLPAFIVYRRPTATPAHSLERHVYLSPTHHAVLQLRGKNVDFLFLRFMNIYFCSRGGCHFHGTNILRSHWLTAEGFFLY